MTTVTFVRRFLSDYTRNPVNLLLLAVVPVVFVIVVAGSLTDAAKLLAGPGGITVQTASAGWAAAFLAGIAMYFQTAATRDTDRRVVVAGLAPARLVAARLTTGLILALVAAAAAALIALAVKTGLDEPVRAGVGTLMFAVVYVAIGALVGTLVRNPVNGTVIVLFIWILDVFFGPAMGAADRPATRPLPTHFVTLWMVDLPSGHGGRIGDFGWGLLWTLVAVASAWAVTVGRTRRARPHRLGSGSVRMQLVAASRAAWHDARRNPALWVLFVIVPLVFIWTADAVTPDAPITLRISENGDSSDAVFAMPQVHGATMAPIAIASLAALVGLFAMADARDGDRRAALAGMRTTALLGARLAVLATAALTAAAISLAATAVVFDAARWPTYIGANLLLALTYALVGALLAPLFGRVGGVFVAFLLPFLDIGVSQSPMLHPQPATAATYLPGYGGSRVLLDGALTAGFDETRPLLAGLAWLIGLLLLVTVTYRRSIAPARPSITPGGRS